MITYNPVKLPTSISTRSVKDKQRDRPVIGKHIRISHPMHCHTLLLLFSSILSAPLVAHETFLRPESHELKPKSTFEVAVFTGNFDRSVFPMDAASVEKLELHSAGEIRPIATDQWTTINSGSKFWGIKQKVLAKLGGTDLRDTGSFPLSISKTGTHVIGLEFKQARVALEFPKFRTYLANEVHMEIDVESLGFPDPSEIIIEGYTKIAKSIIQVGEKITEIATEPIGQTVEIIPMTHPAKVKKGDTLDLKILFQGHPIVGQSVLVGWKPGAFKDSIDTVVVYKSNRDGIVSFPVTETGVWWANFILIQHRPDSDELDFESLWSSLTFNIQ